MKFSVEVTKVHVPDYYRTPTPDRSHDEPFVSDTIHYFVREVCRESDSGRIEKW